MSDIRYFFIPYIFTAWYWVSALKTAHLSKLLASVAMALMIFSSLTAYRFRGFPDLHWKTYASQIESGRSFEIPIPGGYKIKIKAQDSVPASK